MNIEAVKQSINIVDVAIRLGLEVKGNRSRCFHPENHANGDRTPSLSFLLSRGIFKCFGCDIGGDVFALVQQVKGCGFPEAFNFVTGKVLQRQGYEHESGKQKVVNNNRRIDNICNLIYPKKPESYPCCECLCLFDNVRILIEDDFNTRVVKCGRCGTKSRLDFRNGCLFDYGRLI